MKEKLYIIGAGSVGGHVASNLTEYTEEFEISGFFDDDPDKIGTEQFGYRVLGSIDKILKLNNVCVVIGIAFPKIKRSIIRKLKENSSLIFPSLVHPKSWISDGVIIGNGCIVYPGTSINYGCKIGDFVVMNMNCALGHHTQVGNYSSLAPGVNTGGHTIIRKEVDVGIGVSTKQDVKLGTGSIIGGQCMVINDVEEGVRVSGVPAKRIKK